MDASSRKRAIIGLLLVIVGVVFLLDNLGFDINFPRHLLRWPMVFVVIGVINLVSGNLRPAIIFLALGTVFYLQYFDIIQIREIWPVVLIIIGITFLLRRRQTAPVKDADQDTFDEIAIFGGIEKKFVSQKLKGGKVTSLFGGAEIDLRGSRPVEGAVIEIFCMFGGVEIFVPEDWKVNVSATAIFGGFSDERKSTTPDPSATIHIKGFVMFGGGDLKN